MRIVNDGGNVLMVVAGRHGVATEKKSHPRWRRATGRLTAKLGEHLPVPLVVVPPDVPLSHICLAMAEYRRPEEDAGEDEPAQ